jgi:hypothetical protein
MSGHSGKASRAKYPPICLEGRCLTAVLIVATEWLIGSPLPIGKPLHIQVMA